MGAMKKTLSDADIQRMHHEGNETRKKEAIDISRSLLEKLKYAESIDERDDILISMADHYAELVSESYGGVVTRDDLTRGILS